MSLNMYLGEVRTQSQSMNAFCVATIQGMEQTINSIDAFVFDAVLQGQTYDSAKTFFAQTFRPLAQGIIYLCEELIRQNNAFPNDFQSQVATTDVIEQEILEQIQGIERAKAGIDALSQTLPGIQALVFLFDSMKRKLQEKLEHLHEFNYTSSSNYDAALQLAASITRGLAEVQSGKGFNPASGTFNIQGLNMDWVGPIQKITEEKIRQAKLEEERFLKEQKAREEANRPWYQKTAISAFEFLLGAAAAATENATGLKQRPNDELESKKIYQAGKLAGDVLSALEAIFEIEAGITLIVGTNIGAVLVSFGTGGIAAPGAAAVSVAVTTAGLGVISHGGYVGYNTFQNSVDTLQRFHSSNEFGGGVKGDSVPTLNWSGKEFSGIGKKYTPNQFIEQLEKQGWVKSIQEGGGKSGPATILTNPTTGEKVRIHLSPSDGRPYFRIQNKGGNYLDDSGGFPSNATRQEVRDLTHFYFE